MKQLFDSLKRKHPGFDVIDIRFSIGPDPESDHHPDVMNVDALDSALAQSVQTAVEVDIKVLCL